MGNYNPKTANQFRWQDSIKIQKFIQGYLVVNDIDFKNTQNYITEDIPEAKKLVDMIKYCYENQVPLIIYDYSNDRVWNSTYLADEQNATLISYGSDRLYMVGLTYNGVDTLEVNYVQEEFLIADNVKTIFGQDIVGTGDIDLYRHLISVKYNDNSGEIIDCTFEYISSKNLKVNSLQNLTSLTKAKTGTTITAAFTKEGQNFELYSLANAIMFDGTIWKAGLTYNGEDLDDTFSFEITPTRIIDIVTTI